MLAEARFSSNNPFPFWDAVASSDLEKILAAYFQASNIGFALLDSELRYLSINEALAQMNGVPVAQHLGKTTREILGDVADFLEPKLRSIFLTGEPVLNLEGAGKLPHRAEPGHWTGHFIPVKDLSGSVKRVAAIVLERTQEKKMQAALADLSRQLNYQQTYLQVLHEISRILSENWNIQQVFPAISARIRRALRQEYAGFEVHDSGSGLLVRYADDFPLGRGHLERVQISSKNSPGGKALELGRPILFSGEQLTDFDAEIARRFVAEGFRSLCCVPLLRPKGPLGVLVLGSTRDHAFRPADFELLNQVAFLLGTALENQRAHSEIQALKQRLAHERQYLEGEVRSKGEFSEIVGESRALKQVLEQVATVAPSRATVLILGETGTGKELIARAIHRMSRNRKAAFVKLNCAAIPTGLLESELFGHEKGAFTGAVGQKIGRLELADGGTLFLDEVGEISLELQPKLLRVLQDQEFERLGSTRTIRVNVRLVAATNRDLARSVVEHQFRNDLFYRLNVFPIHMPPLRERPEDIPLLVRYFVRKFAQTMERHIETIPKETMAALTNWHWPGNIRELENLMERSVILSSGRALHVPPLEQLRCAPDSPLKLGGTLSSAEREHIIRILQECGGVISGAVGAAQRLGLKRTTLQSKMQRLGITRQDYMPPKKQ